jgi:prophage regulatory protein
MVRIMRRNEVLEAVRLAQSTIYGMVKKGEFPAPRQLGEGAVGWLSNEIEDWIQNRPVAQRGRTAWNADGNRQGRIAKGTKLKTAAQ